ncbi:MAG: slipin family protein [Candidatus Omnitrophica bacterium]|nr:slipin family protein [Candidatus Omnitrophota bacterium]
MSWFFMLLGFAVMLAYNWFKFPREYERLVVFFLGRVVPKPRGPGFTIVMWPFEQAVKVSMRVVTLDVPPQDVITKDNISAKVNAVAYFRVMDPVKAIVEVQNYQYATSQMAQTTLRSVLGELELDDILSKREEINEKLQTILDRQTDPWGIKISNVELKHVDITDDLRKAMARQAEAERERRAKIIASEGEFQAAAKICQAAEMMEKFPMALQLRYLQTLVEIGSENNTTTIFPIPIDILKTFQKNDK